MWAAGRQEFAPHEITEPMDSRRLRADSQWIQMAYTIKNAEQIDKMRVAGRLAGDVLDMITPHVQPGITTAELNRICHEYIVEQQQAIPAPLNYRGFPKSICTSVNYQVCHGIPRVLTANRCQPWRLGQFGEPFCAGIDASDGTV